jgi:hypothetical protein
MYIKLFFIGLFFTFTSQLGFAYNGCEKQIDLVKCKGSRSLNHCFLCQSGSKLPEIYALIDPTTLFHEHSHGRTGYFCSNGWNKPTGNKYTCK